MKKFVAFAVTQQFGGDCNQICLCRANLVQVPADIICALHSPADGAWRTDHVVHGPIRHLSLTEVDIGPAERGAGASRTAGRRIDRPRMARAIYEAGCSRTLSDSAKRRRYLLKDRFCQHCLSAVDFVAIVCGDIRDNQGQHADGANYKNSGRHEGLYHRYSGVRPAALPLLAMFVHIAASWSRLSPKKTNVGFGLQGKWK